MWWAVSPHSYREVKRLDQASEVWTFLEGLIKVEYSPNSMELDDLVECSGRGTIPPLAYQWKLA
jgi:hypothetical protein